MIRTVASREQLFLLTVGFSKRFVLLFVLQVANYEGGTQNVHNDRIFEVTATAGMVAWVTIVIRDSETV